MRHELLKAIDAVNTHRRDNELAHGDALAKARKLGETEPRADLPRAASPKWVRTAAKILRDEGAAAWYAHDDIAEDWDVIDMLLAQLRTEPEFETTKTERIDIRWSTSAMIERDVVADRVVLGKMSVVSAEERSVWPRAENADGDDVTQPPSFRFKLSMPAFLLATTDEVERGLHEMLCQCGLSAGKPVKRKPDIAAHSATLARYGATGIREAQAVASAMAHPETRRALVEYRFDPTSGQGILWPAKMPRQPSLTGWEA